MGEGRQRSRGLKGCIFNKEWFCGQLDFVNVMSMLIEAL
jgi:hypothetical protein